MVGDLLGDDDAGTVTGTAFGVVRAVQFAAIALALGAALFAWLCWLPGLRATAAGAALSADVIGDVLGTRFGTVWALAWMAIAALAAAPRPVPVLTPASVGATGLALPGTRGLAIAAVVALWASNRRRLLPALIRSAREAGPFSADADIGPARLELTVDPARVGPNEMHVYRFDRGDGRQYDETKELTVTAELPEKRIEPLERRLQGRSGHYLVSGAALGVEGEWTLEIAARVSDFDEFRTKLNVPIR